VIVIHAGMPKTGSTSVQLWLSANLKRLREQGYTVVVAPHDQTGKIEFAPFDGAGSLNSGWLVPRAIGNPARARRLGEAFAAAMRDAAERYGNLIVTGERLAPLFGSKNLALPALQRLSMRHEIRVAYYARPQHTAMEALWREFGFRSGKQPSVFLRDDVDSLHYAASRAAVRALAPGLRFEPRPFCRDLLESGDVVADLAARFLGVKQGEQVRWANRGLPLEAINLLRALPRGAFGRSPFDVERLRRSYELLADHQLPEEERTALSRRVLQKYAYETYAAENAKLGWHDFVPPPDDPASIPGLEALDELWKPRASPAELALLARALDASST
jgi:hypothetical protein